MNHATVTCRNFERGIHPGGAALGIDSRPGWAAREVNDGPCTIDVYAAIERMIRYANGVSAKSHDFGSDGKKTLLDYAWIMKIVSDAGYRGFVGVEVEENRLSDPEGTKATKKLLESLRGSMYTL